jgi:hypothetical protein
MARRRRILARAIATAPNSGTVETPSDRRPVVERLNQTRESCPGELQEDIMAKGQMRSTKEKKKPKAEWTKKKKGGPAPSPFALGQSQAKTDPYAKKG